MYRYSDIM
jgi:hypothetical protein